MLNSVLDQANLKKLEALDNKKVMANLEMAIKLCKPAKVTVITDSSEDIAYLRNLAIENGEERKLKMKGHTIHFDGMQDQARDKANTRYLLEEEVNWGMDVNYIMKDKGLPEVLGFLDGAMVGKEMLVTFFALGPQNSDFTIGAMQITDSSYVVHSETLLYRAGYEHFKSILKGSDDFFFFLHSAGELDERNNTKNIDKRRIYIDLAENTVYTVNNQYAGNSVGLKKLAFRLAIKKAHTEGWLAEHMFVMGVHGKPGRITYFAGAFPSACGKTSTAMIPGQTIVGDDIAYLKKVDGKIMSVNVEQGVFGIIKDVNEAGDPEIWKALTTPGEVIFSNVLINDGTPYWSGMGIETPKEGENYSGEWFEGKKDKNGKEILLAHNNSRYTIRISELENADVLANAPEGVDTKGLVFGGRDSDTTVPVVEALDWAHGVMIGATIESETTSATLGAEGVRVFNPMANLDFIAIPLGDYIKNYLDFQNGVDEETKVYGTNYFLKDDNGKWCNGMLDKKIWMLWADGRVNGEYDAIKSPVGYLPKYEDLKNLFKANLDKDYSEKEYNQQFSIRVDKYLAKMDRMIAIYSKVKMPAEFTAQLENQVRRLKEAREKYGSVITPDKF
ncbi:MAG: phosphoenolpyruvate carboxykinase (GTP) [Clostridia bacterium]|nr:phosphoenolpyruvate carboxykinase (GTP) [Clostridia bacterium]MBN2882150.1 phosphoenolpyruvate carboxykinase (GTP) [Clostridia bacterium]